MSVFKLSVIAIYGYFLPSSSIFDSLKRLQIKKHVYDPVHLIYYSSKLTISKACV